MLIYAHTGFIRYSSVVTNDSCISILQDKRDILLNLTCKMHTYGLPNTEALVSSVIHTIGCPCPDRPVSKATPTCLKSVADHSYCSQVTVWSAGSIKLTVSGMLADGSVSLDCGWVTESWMTAQPYLNVTVCFLNKETWEQSAECLHAENNIDIIKDFYRAATKLFCFGFFE